jgi:hypothetical protein
LSRRFTPLAAFVFTVLSAGSAEAQDSGRLELTFDGGYGFGSEGGYGELAMDFRAFTDRGVGGVLRAGVATQLFSSAFALDLGFAFCVDLAGGERGGLVLSGAVGPSFAYGPFDLGWVDAWGGFALLGLDFWHRHFVVGIGVSAHALVPASHDRQASWAGEVPGRDEPLVTIAPMLRVGWVWR